MVRSYSFYILANHDRAINELVHMAARVVYKIATYATTIASYLHIVLGTATTYLAIP